MAQVIIDPEKCIGCGECAGEETTCIKSAFSLVERPEPVQIDGKKVTHIATVEEEKCILCGCCGEWLCDQKAIIFKEN